MKLRLTRAIPEALVAFLLAAIAPASASPRIELIEIPPGEVRSASSTEGRSRPLTLSEQHARTGVGTRYVSAPPGANSGAGAPLPLVVYECRELISDPPGTPDGAALVIELSRRRAYLLVNGLMLLETDVLLEGGTEQVATGWFPITGRSRDSAVPELPGHTPAYWLKLGESGTAIHCEEVEGEPEGLTSIRLPRPAMASLYPHAQPGTMVYVCSSWLEPAPASVHQSPTEIGALPPVDRADETIETALPDSSAPVPPVADRPEPRELVTVPVQPAPKPIPAQPDAGASRPKAPGREKEVSSATGDTEFPGTRLRDLFRVEASPTDPPKTLTPVSGQTGKVSASMAAKPVRRVGTTPAGTGKEDAGKPGLSIPGLHTNSRGGVYLRLPGMD